MKVLFCLWSVLLHAVGLWGQSVFFSPPREYAAHYCRKAPAIDGKKNMHEWSRAAWSTLFVDIEGGTKPAPALATRMKLLWDSEYLYVLIDIQEPDLWATLSHRDDIIYRDHDVELFIDPDGDTHRYIEIEINALGTLLDLYMDKPYKKGGKADLAWNLDKMKTAVRCNGTLNDAGDTDKGWTVEMAIPFDQIEKVTGSPPPQMGSCWRMNFSRVEWLMDRSGDGYQKRKAADGKALPEQNWVWSPQGVIDMHIPELWGRVYFTK